MNRLANNLFNIGISIILAVCGVAASIITVLSFLFYEHYSTENVVHRYWNPPFILLAILLILLLLFLFNRICRHLSCRVLFLVSMAVYAAAGIVLIICCPDSITDDAWMVFQYVQAFDSGDYSGLGRVSYITFATHQLGFLAYEQFLYHVFHTERVFFCCNLIYVIFINLVSWKFTELRTGKDSRAAKYAIFLSFLFFPLLFLVLFAYGNVPSLLLLYTAFYLLGKEIKCQFNDSSTFSDNCNKNGNSALRLVAIAVLSGTACLLKPNSVLGLIVIVLILLLCFLRKHNVWLLAAAAGTIVCAVIFSSLIDQHYERISGYQFRDGGVPKISYIAMGLQEDPGGNADRAGMYNGFVFDSWFDTDGDVDYCVKASELSISERMRTFADHPGYAIGFFLRKLTGTWCEPTFMSTWSGPWSYQGIEVHGSLLQNLYRNGAVFMAYQFFMRGYIHILYLLFSIGIWELFQKRKTMSWKSVLTASILPLWFLSGFCYHLISETKSQYVFQYAFAMIPIASAVLTTLDEHLVQKLHHSSYS